MKRGRPPSLLPHELQHVRDLYFVGRKPNGRRYSLTDIARLYKVSIKTIASVIERKGPYK